ncbi:beta subunit of assimilatory sulfite reductase [Protomyces lactucae-debilis]|uniref:Sulfite reductase [NADPH] subunit beta n=1 Tax=Protomyces lactucae-debilis TaxID=2754530 RepID=A0A1Y2F3W9_PROLT|nr:beta subunit of assimilatory sulfite reductase [Protomyces lactucae-debilis]ORY78184.1 beta subunit of assimilatory sulfite reductase [Protomyces lactucae-debilis]
MVAASPAIASIEEAVARVAFLTSDTVYSVQASFKQANAYTPTLKQLASQGVANVYSPEVPRVEILRANADPFLSVLEHSNDGRLASVVTSSATLIQAIPHLYRLALRPVTLFVDLATAESSLPDYADISSLRSTGFTIFQATTLQEAQDLAIVARSVAIESGKGSILFYESITGESISVEDRSFIERSISTEAALEARAAEVPAQALYLDEAPKRFRNEQDAEGKDIQVQVEAKTSVDVLQLVSTAFSNISTAFNRTYAAFEYTGSAQAESAILLFGSNATLFKQQVAKSERGSDESKIGILTLRVYRPWSAAELSAALPAGVTKIAVLEQIKQKTTKWTPLFLDALVALNGSGRSLVAGQLGYNNADTVAQALRGVVQNLQAAEPLQNMLFGQDLAAVESIAAVAPKLESAYEKILNQLFAARLNIANKGSKSALPAAVSSNPEFALGALLARQENRQAFIKQVSTTIKDGSLAKPTVDALDKWTVQANNKAECAAASHAAIAALEQDSSEDAKALLASKELFDAGSDWIIGSDAWAYDLGNSGVHHLLATGLNANMLIIDSTPYSARNAEAANKRKKDIGLYAMNFGNAYVASTAVYASYTQVLAAMVEADKFDGPSVVLAYLPYEREDDTPVTVLQETKNAVESGYWPLYRYTPSADTSANDFQLDSERLQVELKAFLKRENHLSQLAARDARFAASLAQSYGAEVRNAQKRKAKQAFDKMLDGLSGPPLTILYASDGGNAANLAKRLQRRAKARSLKAKVLAMDDFPVEDLASEPNLVLISATAGQGEIPQNGRNFWDAVKASMDLDLKETQFAVFAMGDSHYWPRAADKHYYNKPGMDLHKRFLELGAKSLIDITVSMGDDQDPDGYETGYQAWEPELWKAFGVDHMDVVVDEPKARTPEDVKVESNFLRGGIVAGLADGSTGAISADDALLTKFHGTYMQDDRDVREQRKADGLEPAYSFMIRARLPAGVAKPWQWLQMDEISDTYGNHTFKLTTRQTFQWHGVLKRKLKKTIAAINKALITTIAACGDVNRNVMCSTIPTLSAFHAKVFDTAKGISDHLLPSTSAYHEIWLTDEDGNKAQVAGDAIQNKSDTEPLYGPTYLPRKFKIAVAVPPYNDVDVFTNDVGFIAIRDDAGELAGFNVSIGGGMGTTHNNKKTYPRLGTVMAFCTPEQVNKVAEGIMICQRDHGDRKDRKHARMKYTIDDYGVPFFREFVEKYIGYKLEEPRPYEFIENVDHFGWQKGEDGKNHFGMFIENGRVEDTPDFQMKTGLRELAKMLDEGAEFRLTSNQHVILSNVDDSQLDAVKDVLAKYRLDNLKYSSLRLSSSACVAFPTCGLAMAESERYLPVLITKLEETIIEAGLEKESIVMRMSGCPNACSRPWVAEIALVGKAFNTYNLYLGGGYHGQRLNKLYKASIQESEILDILRPMLKEFALKKKEGQHFGDFVIERGYIVATREGKDFHDDVPEEDELVGA